MMKYLTKEWYLAVQNSYHHQHLVSDKRAAIFSEEYFLELYCASEQDHLDFHRSVCNLDRDELVAKLTGTSSCHVDGSPLSKEEQNIVSSFQDAFAEALCTAPEPVFDPEKEKLEYHRMFVRAFDQLKYMYPPEILEKVADPRVLALEHAAPDVIAAIEQYCLQNRALADSRNEANRAEDQKNWKNRKPAFFKDFYFHDNQILSMEMENSNAILTFDTNVACRFKNAVILKCDCATEKSIWLYNEIYPVAAGYEIHALLLTKPEMHFCIDSYADLIIQCSNVEITQEAIP